MSYSQSVCFHITLIPRRWYNDKKASIKQQIHRSILVYQLVENKLNQLAPQPLSFNHLENIRETVYVEHKRSPKQKYGLGMGYAKKALDYAIRADNVDKFVNYLEKFIERTKAKIDEESTENVIIGDPISVKHKGRQPKRYRLEGHISGSTDQILIISSLLEPERPGEQALLE
ncbi:hypothetical protein C2G38_2030517 [Gigaspora rosea]|uniref:Uncharacterized protein n=1 Tax=Gigaspora rosea TaxID=44941 RepID=A0A397VU42_9GLOM|nr:hypothetical protein C2G38_2030517 [Gigaspora rosea]